MEAINQLTSEKQNVGLAVDAAIFTVEEGVLKVILIQMNKRPYEGQWALPGGLIAPQETTEQAIRRILSDQCGVADVHVEQLATFDEPNRDPRARVVSVAYIALIPPGSHRLETTHKYQGIRWCPVGESGPLAYDHDHVLSVAVERLRGKLSYTNIAWSLLPPEFTLSQIQAVYEAIGGCALDKRNFRKRLLTLGIIESTGRRQSAAAHRPAELFRFQDRSLKIVCG